MTRDATPSLPDDPQLAEWCGELRIVALDFREMTAGQSDEMLRWRPGPGHWSIAECIDHVANTNEIYVAHLAPVIQKARARGRTGDGPHGFGLFGGWWVRMLSPGGRKVPAPARFAPAADVAPDEALARFERSQTALAELLESADGLALGRIRAPSVVTRLVRLNLAAWIAGLVAHERRHLAQARRVEAAYRSATR